MQDFLNAVANFGFPIVVAGYLLFRMEKTIDNLSVQITNLKTEIIKLCDKIDK